MSGLLVQRTAVTLLIFFIMLSAVPISQGMASDGTPVVTSMEDSRYRAVTEADLVSLMSAVGVRDPLANYNTLVDGMGTGLAPPTLEEWTLFQESAILDDGADQYEVPTANSMDLSTEPYFPQVRSQGSEGSCAAFSLTYYNYGYVEARDQGWSGAKNGSNDHLLSPSWTYNKVNGDGHEGASFQENARIIKQLGAATWTSYPYVASDDEGMGTEAAWRSAPAHRVSNFVSLYSPSPTTIVDVIKEQLGLHRPMSFAIDANEYGAAFADGNKIMSALEYEHSVYNHGQTVVGYDDAITDDGDVGAFKVVNSWGTSWGQSGYYYITYSAIKEMLGYPMMYLLDLEDHQPSLLATWTFSVSPSVDASMEMGAGSSTAPTDKVSTYFSTGSTNRMSAFMAIDASALYNEYTGGEDSYYLKVGPAATGGTVSSFRLELYSSGYVPGSPTGVIAQSGEVPKAVPGVVNAALQTEDTIPPTSEVLDPPSYLNITSFTLDLTSSDTGGSGVDHLELYYRYNLGSYVRYAPASDPSGEWTGNSVTFNITEAGGQGPYQFYSVAVDGNGNREAAPTVADASTTVDMVAPMSTISKNGVLGDDGWYVSTVSVTMSASDQWSGVGSITYRNNGGQWTVYSSPLSLVQGSYVMEWYATDRAGNREVARNTTIKVDTGAPDVTITLNDTPTNGWYRSAVTAVLEADDDLDPECPVQYRLDGGAWLTYQGALLITAQGQHLLESFATDQAGNDGTVISVHIDIDTSAPDCDHALQGEVGEEGRYVTAVNVTLLPSDLGSGVDIVRYRLDGGAWQNYSSILHIAEDGIYALEYYALDRAGNSGPVVSVEIMIDSQGPTVAVSTDRQPAQGWFNGAVNVTLTGLDLFDDGCPVHFRLDGGEWQTYVSALLFDQQGWYILEYRAVDLAGNLGAIGSLDIGIDGTAPVCSVSSKGTSGLNGYYVSAVKATLSASDAGSGVDLVRYRLNGGAWTAYQGPFTISMEGMTALEYYAVDRAGNPAEIRSATFKIDTKAPVITFSTNAVASSGWYNSSVTVTLTPGATDIGCPIHYRLNEGSWTPYSGGVTVVQDGTNALEWYGTDAAGNQGSSVSRALLLDLVAPECSLTINGKEGSNGYYVSTVKLTIGAVDHGSGAGRTLYRMDGGEWVDYTSNVEIPEEGEHTIEYFVQDRAGNSGDVLFTELNIDISAPLVSFEVLDEMREDGTYLNDATLSFVVRDDVSGVASIIYSLDLSAWRAGNNEVLIEGEGAHNIRLYAVDQAGNNATTLEMSLVISMPVEAPGPVHGFNATVVEDGIYLSWSPSDTELEARYLVFRSVDGEEELIANITGTSYLDQAVEEGVSYGYRVVAMNTVGAGPAAEILGLAMPEDAQEAPYLLIAAISLSAIAVAAFIWKRR